MKKFWQYPWVVGVRNIVLMMLIYTISRLFFYLISLDLYPNVSTKHLIEMMVGGLRFDVTALFYLNAVYMVMMFLPIPARTSPIYQNIAKWFYWIPNAIGIIANCIDMVYVRFSARRTTIAFFSEFQNDDNLGHIIATSALQYWYVTVFALCMLAALVLLFRKTCIPTPLQEGRKKAPVVRNSVYFYLHGTLLFCLSVYFVVIGIRSGFGAFTRPITLSNALQYTNTPGETNIVLNTPFCLLRSTESKSYTLPHYMDEEEMKSIMTPYHPADTTATFTPKNVVILILESMSKEYIGYYNHDLDHGAYKGYTPFLDSLIAHSTTYRYSYSSGRKSIDAMPSVLASIPRIGTPYILTPYSTNDIPSLAWSLNKKGYHTAFYHGAPNGSMGFLAFAKSCGFQEYYGKTEYDNDKDYDGYWAIWDEEFLQFYARSMSTLPQPFLTSVFTATSHHPFQVPERHENTFPTGTHPLHHCIGYVDMALRKFFDYARQQPWYENTLFVLTADHTNALHYAEYQNDKGVYEVPIIFYDPSLQEGKMIDAYPVCQADIMPSVLAYLGYDSAYNSFGEDILTKEKEHPYVVVYNEPVYQIFSDSLMLQVDEQGNIVSAYLVQDDRLLEHNIKDQVEQSQEVAQMVLYLKAYVQQYIGRMMDNRLTVE